MFGWFKKKSEPFPSLGHVPPRPIPAPARPPTPFAELMREAELEHHRERGAKGSTEVLAKRIIALEARVAKLEKQ